MSRPALFTYAGALRILGKYDRPWLDGVDMALGGAILVGGAVAGPDVLGLIDPKNEAMGSLRKVLDGVSAKLTGLSGTNRQELVVAAHTVFAVNSVFDAYRDVIGPDFDRLDVTDREKFRALDIEPTGRKEVELLPAPAPAALHVPAPSATRGFHENLGNELSSFLHAATARVLGFLTGAGGLAGAVARGDSPELRRTVHEAACDKYLHHYLGLAAEVPEFQVWMIVGEHAATRTEVKAVGAQVADALSVRSESMERLSRLLSLFTPGELPWDRAYRRKLENAAATLAKPLLRTNADLGRGTRGSRRSVGVSWRWRTAWPSTTTGARPPRRTWCACGWCSAVRRCR